MWGSTGADVGDKGTESELDDISSEEEAAAEMVPKGEGKNKRRAAAPCRKDTGGDTIGREREVIVYY